MTIKTNKKKVVLKYEALRLPEPLYSAIFKESLKRSKLENKTVSKNTIMVEVLTEKFLSNSESNTGIVK